MLLALLARRWLRKPSLTPAQAARHGGSCGSPPKLRWKPGLTKLPNPSSSCGHSGLPGVSSGLGWVEVGQAWLSKPRQLAGGGRLCFHGYHGCGEDLGEGRSSPVGPYSLAELPLLL